MIPKLLDHIALSHIQSLIDNQVHESKAIEYKRDLPGNSAEDRREFLKDVSSFANTDGGDLLFGVNAKRGIPVDILGIDVPDQDALRLQLENILRDALQPRIPDVKFKFVAVGEKSLKFVLVVRVKKSWAAPHRVIIGGHGHFYSRNSAGVYALDVDQLRSAFLQAQSVEDRIREFRRNRVAAISVGETPVPIVDGAKFVLHLIPLSAFASRDLISMEELQKAKPNFAYLDSSGWSQTTNIDGIVLFQIRGDENRAYTQTYRNGCVEAVITIHEESDGKPILSSAWYERATINYAASYAKALFALGVSTPIFVLLSLLNARGCKLHIGDRGFMSDRVPLDREALLLSEVSIEEQDFKSGLILKPVFDSIWHAFNHPSGTRNVNDAGDWVGPR